MESWWECAGNVLEAENDGKFDKSQLHRWRCLMYAPVEEVSQQNWKGSELEISELVIRIRDCHGCIRG